MNADFKCQCAADSFCPLFKRNMRGRLHAICQGTAEGISEATRLAYLDAWQTIAASPPVARTEEQPLAIPKGMLANAKVVDVVTKLILHNKLCPGDVLISSCIASSLTKLYPGHFQVDYRSCCNDIFKYNPYITPLNDQDPEVKHIELHYDLIHQSNQRPIHFLEAYCHWLGEKLGIALPCQTNKPDLFLGPGEELRPLESPYVLINAGGKTDCWTKKYPTTFYQDIVDAFPNMQFVQIGEDSPGHIHVRLKNVLDLVGKTTTRQLIWWSYHAIAGIGGTTFLAHVFGAWSKPYWQLMGSREPLHFTCYNTTHQIHNIGLFPCAKEGGCWKSHVCLEKTDGDHCRYPTQVDGELVAGCQAAINAEEIIWSMSPYLEPKSNMVGSQDNHLLFT